MAEYFTSSADQQVRSQEPRRRGIDLLIVPSQSNVPHAESRLVASQHRRLSSNESARRCRKWYLGMFTTFRSGR